jgi:hypothetical protein
LIFEPHPHPGTRNDVITLLKARTPDRLDFVVHRPVGHAVGGQYLVELAQFGIVLSNELPVDNARYPLRAQKGRLRPGFRFS